MQSPFGTFLFASSEATLRPFAIEYQIDRNSLTRFSVFEFCKKQTEFLLPNGPGSYRRKQRIDKLSPYVSPFIFSANTHSRLPLLVGNARAQILYRMCSLTIDLRGKS